MTSNLSSTRQQSASILHYSESVTDGGERDTVETTRGEDLKHKQMSRLGVLHRQ
jgi:hypothetical protein